MACITALWDHDRGEYGCRSAAYMAFGFMITGRHRCRYGFELGYSGTTVTILLHDSWLALHFSFVLCTTTYCTSAMISFVRDRVSGDGMKFPCGIDRRGGKEWYW